MYSKQFYGNIMESLGYGITMESLYEFLRPLTHSNVDIYDSTTAKRPQSSPGLSRLKTHHVQQPHARLKDATSLVYKSYNTVKLLTLKCLSSKSFIEINGRAQSPKCILYYSLLLKLLANQSTSTNSRAATSHD